MPEIHPLPRRVRLMTQRIPVKVVDNLHIPCGDADEETDVHKHPAYGVYDERDQTISIDAHLPFERQRETLLHECLHAMLSVGQLDSLLTQESVGLDEHVVGALAPILLSFLRDNPRAVAYLMEVQA